ncbi:AMP-binding protein [Cyanobacteria bacterium FACHB-63]|nr:AMP-binding protein [Cyanobacteria bacterium FACHB-63]
MLVHQLLERSADRLADKVALICGEERLTYAGIECQANRLAHALRALGVQRGDRIALFLPNCTELVISIFASLKTGGVFVPINHTTRLEKCAYVLNHCQARVLITSGRQATLASQLAQRVSSLKAIILTAPIPAIEEDHAMLHYDAIQADYPEHRLSSINIDLDLACLIYTSGSTGDPKGVMSDHSNVVFAASSIIQYLENVESDTIINALPLSFDYGLYQLIMSFYFGGTLVLERGFTFPAIVLKRIETERVTGFPGVPTLFSVLLHTDLSRYDLSSLRYITNTAAALPASHIAAIRAMFPTVKLFSMYGLTETKRTLYLPPEQLNHRPGSVGIAIPGTEVWIEDERGERLRAGEVGELVVRGRHVMRGYWNDPERSTLRFRSTPLGDRLCYTGDLFRMDEEGYLYFVARKDDMIKSRGEKVAPKEVENVLYALSGVREAAVIGVPDARLGQAVKAFVVIENDAEITEAHVLRHCHEHLEDFMMPQWVEFCRELPKTSTGKIKKTELT